MTLSFDIHPTDELDGALVNVGPNSGVAFGSLQIPSTFERQVVYKAPSLVLTVKCAFSGERYEISKMTIEGRGDFVTSRDLTQLKLPALMRAMALAAIPDSFKWTEENKAAALEVDANRAFLAQIYWFETVTWGNPRQEIMNWLSVSRTTANEQIRKLAKEFKLPGAHARP